MAVEIKKTGGPLSGKVRRTAQASDPNAWMEISNWLRAETVPLSDVLNEQERVASAILIEAGFPFDQATGLFTVPPEADVNHPSPFWYCFEILMRARKARMGVSEEQLAFLGLAVKVGRLMKELELLAHEARLEKAYGQDEAYKTRGRQRNAERKRARQADYDAAIAAAWSDWPHGHGDGPGKMAHELMKKPDWAGLSHRRLVRDLKDRGPKFAGHE